MSKAPPPNMYVLGNPVQNSFEIIVSLFEKKSPKLFQLTVEGTKSYLALSEGGSRRNKLKEKIPFQLYKLRTE